MKLEIKTNGKVETVDITALATEYSSRVTVGRKCKQVWNAIAIEDEQVDVFQCRFLGAQEAFRIFDGQERTECPKGLLSSRMVPCNGCTGRCVNIRAGRPKYIEHKPETATLLNGKPIGIYGDEVNRGDIITVGDVVITVI